MAPFDFCCGPFSNFRVADRADNRNFAPEDLGIAAPSSAVIGAVSSVGSGEAVVAGRGRQRSVAAAAMPVLFQPKEDVMRPLGSFGSSMAMAPDMRHRRRHGGRH
jgi:hypothetical protein